MDVIVLKFGVADLVRCLLLSPVSREASWEVVDHWRSALIAPTHQPAQAWSLCVMLAVQNVSSQLPAPATRPSLCHHGLQSLV